MSRLLAGPLLAACALGLAWAAGASEPGAPPAECWSEPRDTYDRIPGSATERFEPKIDHVTHLIRDSHVTSPNGAYAYERIDHPRPGESGATRVELFVFVERPYLVRVVADDVFQVLDDHWVNGKLLYFRVALGRVAFVDILFDVERERIVHREEGSFGDLLFQQAKESCATPALRESCARRCYRLKGGPQERR